MRIYEPMVGLESDMGSCFGNEADMPTVIRVQDPVKKTPLAAVGAMGAIVLTLTGAVVGYGLLTIKPNKKSVK